MVIYPNEFVRQYHWRDSDGLVHVEVVFRRVYLRSYTPCGLATLPQDETSDPATCLGCLAGQET